MSTAELRNLGLEAVSPLPAAWFSTDQSEHYLQPRIYPSPQMGEDGVAFVQLVSGAENVLETHYSIDGGRSWVLLPSLMEPDLVGSAFLALSPDFSQDTTLTALRGSELVRSTDGGQSWKTWQPRIAFSSDRDGNREIYTMDQEGNDVQRLTDTPAAEENPAWSPAWTRIAFQSNRSGNWDIFTMRIDCDPLGPEAEERCDLRRLTDDPADDLLPAWSPDGRALAFVSTRDGNPEIYVMDSGGGNQHRLTFNSSGDWRPAWLPDSRHLLFVSDRGGNNDIYQLEVPSFDAAPLASEPKSSPRIVSQADDRDPAVAAGLVDRVFFLSDRGGVMRTYTTDTDSQPRPFAETDQPEAHPATLPGAYYEILVSAERDGTVNIYRASLSGYTPLAPTSGFDGHPAGEATGWKPDTAGSLAWLQER
jgi:dipeptidyl aminopeptidase/acylaminoacyl peptidase